MAETLDGTAFQQRGDSALLDGFWSLQLLRQLGLMLGIAASVALGVAVVLWAQGKEYLPLAGGLERMDMVAITNVLEQQQIAHRIDTASGMVMVDSAQIDQARMKLAAAGITAERGRGFEALDKEQPLGSSQFMENARYLRSLEGELARTIMSINAVRNARVHIAIPKASVFLRDRRDVRASVLVEKSSGRDLDPGQVKAIVNLVAGSIPELDASKVTVIDQNGKLLSEDGENPELAQASRQLQYQREYEEGIARRIEGILLPMLGPDKFRAEVSADMDFSQVEQADERFNPDAPAVRSEQTLQEQNGANGQAAGIPGALSNQPPASGAAPEVANGGADGGDASAPAGGKGSAREQATRNFELDRTVSYTRHQSGRLVRLSVAVVLDDQMKPDAEGKPQRVAWSDQELERVAMLVRNAVGFSAMRGDSVNVVNSAFVAREEVQAVDGVPVWEQAWLRDMLRPVIGGIVVLALVFGVLRPVLKTIVEGGQKLREEQVRREMALLGIPDATGEGGAEGMHGAGGGQLMLPSPEESYEQQLSAVKGLIAQDSERVAQVVKKWVNEEG